MIEGKNVLFRLRFIGVRVVNQKHVFFVISSVTIKRLKSF